MKDNIIFVSGTARHDVIFSDLYNDDRVVVLNGTCKEINNALLKKLRKIHLSMRFNNEYFHLPFKKIWSYSLKSIKWSNY